MPQRHLLSALILLITSHAHAQQFIDQAPEIKADCLAIFGYYFTWPDESQDTGDEFTIGLLGRAGFSAERVTSKVSSIRDKQIVVYEFASVGDYRPCHILFVAEEARAESEERTARQRLDAALRVVGDQPVLVVSETDGFAATGPIVNFYVDTIANKVRMQIDRQAAGRAKIGLTRGLYQLERTGKVIFVN